MPLHAERDGDTTRWNKPTALRDPLVGVSKLALRENSQQATTPSYVMADRLRTTAHRSETRVRSRRGVGSCAHPQSADPSLGVLISPTPGLHTGAPSQRVSGGSRLRASVCRRTPQGKRFWFAHAVGFAKTPREWNHGLMTSRCNFSATKTLSLPENKFAHVWRHNLEIALHIPSHTLRSRDCEYKTSTCKIMHPRACPDPSERHSPDRTARPSCTCRSCSAATSPSE